MLDAVSQPKGRIRDRYNPNPSSLLQMSQCLTPPKKIENYQESIFTESIHFMKYLGFITVETVGKQI